MGKLSQSGGSISHNHGRDTGAHVLTIAEMPAHSHDVMINDAVSTGSTRYPETAGIASLRPYPTTSVGGSHSHTHTISSDFNVPPFYALAFIMKIS